MSTLEFGLDTFLPVTVDQSGHPIGGDQAIRNAVEEAVLAEAVGIDSFNIGEHYRTEFMDSAGHVVLAAIASRTERIRLGTAVTVLSTQDPVRLYTDFATLDAVSNGRAQLIVGRGSLTESFPLFGFDLADYEELFEEKLDLLVRLLREQPVTWSGKFRSALTDQFVSPPIPEGHIPTWVGVGGSPQSVVRAARFGLPLMLAIIAGRPERFAPYVELYKRALEQHGQPELPVGLHTLGFVAETDEEAVEIQWPYYKEQFEWAARERGWRPPTYEQFLAEVDHGSMYVGSPETVARPDRRGHPHAQPEPVRPALRHRTRPARAADGDDRALRPRGDPAGARAARRGSRGGRRAGRRRQELTMAVAAIERPKSRGCHRAEVDDLRLGIVGAGKFGTTLARAAVAAGYDVAISGSGPADDIALTVDVLAPGARAATTDEVVRHADIIVLAVPTHRFRELPRDLFAGKILVDAMNYWEPVDGDDPELTTAADGTSMIVQQHFPSARVVKSLNQLGYHQLEENLRPKGAPDRIAIAAAGDDRLAVRQVMRLIDRLGFDPVDAGPLEQRPGVGTRRLTDRHHLQRRRALQARLLPVT